MYRVLLFAGILLAAALIPAGPAVADPDDLDPRDGDVHVHEDQEIFGVYVEAQATCTTADPGNVTSTCSHAVERSINPKHCFGTICLR